MVDEGLLNLVRAHMSKAKVPLHHDKVYKEECMFSFDTPESPGGLYISLTTFQGFGQDYVALDYERDKNALYLHEKWTQLPPDLEDTDNKAEAESAEAASLKAGLEGGLRLALGGAPVVKMDKQQALVVWGPQGEQARIALPCADLPELVLQSIAGVQAHESVSVREAAAVWEEERRVSRFAADLPQLPTNGKKISPNPSDWRCEETGAQDNLWLNLSTGFIGSGRRNWDGSGGNGSALRHYEATGRKYPLVVKLGTITPHGADVYSYSADEDDMVLDPLLDKHLAHWGINMMQMSKSEKTMAELQLELNTSYEFSRITEEGSKALVPAAGPGLTGLINLGNSCYMNSVLQALMVVPSIKQRYAGQAAHVYMTAPGNPADDVASQLSKVAVAVLEGRTGYKATDVKKQVDEDTVMEEVAPAPGAADDAKVRETAVKPQSFKSLIGKGHPEFSSGRQQDALEYFVHLLEAVGRAEHAGAARLSVQSSSTDLKEAPLKQAFAFKLEDRVQCTASNAVSYKSHEELWIGLDIPLDAAVNKEAVEQYKERVAKRERMHAEEAAAYISAEPSDTMVAEPAGSAGAGGAAAGGATDKETPVVPQVPFAACLSQWAGEELIHDVWSAAAGTRTAATKSSRFASFPPFLTLALKRYYTSENWVPKKMEVEVEVPEYLDLQHLKSGGPKPGEVLQPELDEPAATAGGNQAAAAAAAQPAAAPEPHAEHVANLASMGFSENAAKRAVLAVNNAGVEAAMEWLIGHLEDPDINDPPPAPQPAAAAAATAPAPGNGPSADDINTLVGFGFTETQAKAALKACGNNIERAGDWLFSHMDDMDAAVAQVLSEPSAAPAAAGGGGQAGSKQYLDGPGKYELVAIISHMGANTACGHYVAHVKKGGKWYIFNDEKVAESEHPPRDLGYIYMFRRTDVPAA